MTDVEELLSLLRKNDKYEGRPGFREPETLAAIRAIGERLDQAGGFRAMSKVAYEVQAKDAMAASWLNNAWNGIGDWRS